MDKNLRLRLVVRRHGLPEVPVLFSLALDNEPTVAHLLEQINEVLPLESGEWGLEDYVVELRDRKGCAFECLHFQPVASVLEKDDEVFIRPLFTDDLRRRRLSGRHQITSDGRHLIDGVAFGRPRLKPSLNRPAVDIAPRKRRRVAYDDAEVSAEPPTLLLTEHGEDPEPTSVRVDADFYDAGSDDDDAEDGDFETAMEADADEETATDDDADSSDLDEELRDLAEEISASEEDQEQSAELLGSPNRLDSHQKGRKKLEDEDRISADVDYVNKLTSLHLAFPTAPIEICEEFLKKHGGNSKRVYRKLQKVHKAVQSFKAMRTFRKSLVVESVPAGADRPSQNDDEDDDIESVSSIAEHYDEHGFPSGSIDDGTAAVELVKVLQRSGKNVQAPTHIKFPNQAQDKRAADAESSDASNGSSLLDSASDEDSDSDDSRPEVMSALATRRSAAGAFNNSDEDTSSDEDHSSSAALSSDGDSGDSVDSDDDSDDSFDSDSNSDDSVDSDSEDPASEGLNGDQNQPSRPLPSPATRNASGIGNEAPPTSTAYPADLGGQGLTKTQKRNERRRALKRAQRSLTESQDLKSTAETGADLLSRKQVLLDNLTSPQNGASGQPDDAQDVVADVFSGDLNGKTTEEKDDGTAAAKPAERRMRIDLSAGRRMIFGAIGLKIPKTKEDEEKIRNGLMKDVRPLVNHRTIDPESAYQQKNQVADNEQPVETDDPEAWRDKIAYRAVECCQDSVELSEPPFPFIQRWDPRQAISNQDNSRSGRAKRKLRDQAHFYDDSSSTRRTKRRNLDMDDEASTEEHYTFGSEWDAAEPSADLEDLPPLPEHIGSLPELLNGQAKKDMVITWKELTVSEATGWQPAQVSLTARIAGAEDGANGLHVVLAKRNRRQKIFDEEGNRIYGRFEAPDESEEEDDGCRHINYSDMQEPRIVQQPFEDLSRRIDPASSRRTDGGTTGSSAVTPASGKKSTLRSDQLAAGVENDFLFGAIDAEITNGSDSQILAPSAQLNPVEDTFMAEEHQHESGQLTGEGSSYEDVTPMMNLASDLSSPTLQLVETMMAAAATRSTHSSPEKSLNSARTSQDNVTAQFDGVSNGINDDEALSAKSYFPPIDMVSLSQSDSLQSGRQPDPSLSVDLQAAWPDFLDYGADDSGPLTMHQRARDNVPESSKHNSKESSPTHDSTRPALHLADQTLINGSLPSVEDAILTASTSASMNSASDLVSGSSVMEHDSLGRQIVEEESSLGRRVWSLLSRRVSPPNRRSRGGGVKSQKRRSSVTSGQESPQPVESQHTTTQPSSSQVPISLGS